MNLREVGWEFVNWIHLIQERVYWRVLVKTVMAFGFHKRWEFLK
jgi:hypothetical protein